MQQVCDLANTGINMTLIIAIALSITTIASLMVYWLNTSKTFSRGFFTFLLAFGTMSILTFSPAATHAAGTNTDCPGDLTTQTSTPSGSATNSSTPTTPTAPTTMQSLTSSYCTNSMTIYDGTNPEVMLTLNDPRGDGQTYHVAKLADNHCWMLDNLKLGSVAAPLTLTPTDTNIASNFILPQLYSGSDASHKSTDTPEAYGPVPGGTGAGATNYGYLYNFPAATAGETTTTLPGDGTNGDNAPYSICPAGWRLPVGTVDLGSGAATSGDYYNLDIAFGGTGQYAVSGEPNIAQWQYAGPFRGVFAGYWDEGFDGQGDLSILWPASAIPGYPGLALWAGFIADEVYPGNNYTSRDVGSSVRCLLN